MIITEQQSFCKSEFERTILAEACCFQSPGPYLFYKNKGIVSEWFFPLQKLRMCSSCLSVQMQKSGTLIVIYSFPCYSSLHCWMES